MEEYTVEDMLKDLNDEDEEVRANAACELGNAMAVEAIEPLIKALKDESALVREEATCSLMQLKDERAIGPLIEIMPDPDLLIEPDMYSGPSCYPAEALKKIGGEAVVLPLMRAWADFEGGTEYITFDVLSELIEQVPPKTIIADEEAVSNLMYMFGGGLQLEGVDELDNMEKMLRHVGIENLVEICKKRLSKKDPEERKDAVYTLGQLYKYEPGLVIGPLFEMFNDTSPAVRAEVLAALDWADELSDSKAEEVLAKALEDPDEMVRSEAARIKKR